MPSIINTHRVEWFCSHTLWDFVSYRNKDASCLRNRPIWGTSPLGLTRIAWCTACQQVWTEGGPIYAIKLYVVWSKLELVSKLDMLLRHQSLQLRGEAVWQCILYHCVARIQLALPLKAKLGSHSHNSCLYVCLYLTRTLLAGVWHQVILSSVSLKLRCDLFTQWLGSGIVELWEKSVVLFELYKFSFCTEHVCPKDNGNWSYRPHHG